MRETDDGEKTPWISFSGWKQGIVTRKNRVIHTDPIDRMTKELMAYIGENLFKAAKEMVSEDEAL